MGQAVHLVTGYAGFEHIKSEDDGAFNAAFFGNEQFVMESGNQFAASIIDNNTVRILDGDGLMYGRHFRIKVDTYQDITVKTGTAGVNRIDLICMTYAKNTADGTEDVYPEIILGTEASSPVLPSYTNGNILEGAILNQMPLYKVVVEGVVLKEIVPLFKTTLTYKALAEKYAAEFAAVCEEQRKALGVIDTLAEIKSNTASGKVAGALAVKELANEVSTVGTKVTTLEGKVSAVENSHKKTSVTLSTSWSGSDPFTQTVALSGITANSKVDLQPSSAILSQLLDDGVLALYIENNAGTLTAYAIGAKPTTALTIQATITEY
jgi:hypothetical protein